MAKDPVRYWKSNEVHDVARELIEQYHDHLDGESILYIFRSEHAESEGKPIPGVSVKLTGRNAYLVRREYLDDAEEAPGYVLLIEVAHDLWQKMRAGQRVALVDHLLCRFGLDYETQGIALRAPDVVEYREVIDRHGLWRPEVEQLAATLAQFKLFPDGEAKPLINSVIENLIDEANKPDSKTAKALRPKKGSSVSSVTISSGGKSVKLEARD